MRRDLRRALALLSLIEPSEIVFLIALCAATYGLLSLGGM